MISEYTYIYIYVYIIYMYVYVYAWCMHIVYEPSNHLLIGMILQVGILAHIVFENDGSGWTLAHLQNAGRI